jgi:ribosomal protein S18 acetylase RimI-like enzyme
MNKTFEFVPAGRQHVSDIGRICYEAFKEVHEGHGFSLDFPTIDFAQQALGMLVDREDFYGVVALRDGQPVGSNFLFTGDLVAGIGPISVDRSCQGQGIGRSLMQNVMAHAQRNNFDRARLLQDAFNVASISLYASLGFEVKEATAFMQGAPASETDDSVRLITESDLPAIEELSRRIYKSSRRDEVAAAVRYGFAAFLRERHERITGYLIPGLFGHGVAETEEDALALIGEAARRLPPPLARFFCPLSEASLFRRALQAQCRVIKVMNYMVKGPYEPPVGVWMPSVLR